MSSAFERVVKSVGLELDPGRELVPMHSLQSSASFQPYRLLSRKASSRFFRRYTHVNLSIRDILEPDAPEPAVEHVGPFHFQDAVDGHLGGSVEVAAPGQGKIAGGAAVSGSSSASMNVCKLQVPPNSWVAMLRERRLRQPEHKVLRELRSRGHDVFVVTEVLQTQKEVEVTRTHKHEGSGQFSLPGGMCLQGEGKGHLSRKKTVTIPSGSVLAFRVAQLVFTGPEWDVLFVPEKKRRTFTPPQTAGDQPQPPSSLSSLLRSLRDHLDFWSDGVGEDQRVSTEDFRGLQAEAKAWAGLLESMSKTLCEQLLRGLGQLLRDEPALHGLEESLEQGLCCGRAEPVPGPAGPVLECLVLPCRTPVEELAGPVAYLLGALAALSGAQRLLLAEALEASALPEPLELVEEVLEQSSPWQERRALSLPPGLLGDSWGPEVPAWTLLEACGLELQVDAPQVGWEPAAQGCTCALYASLALLSKLSQLC
ncbi:gasdermin-D isoform X2 [Phyllostomus discolor]|uniref:Gasdermin-D isoform X2 n=1 Tax=Phyllostomus discolor TaxID=89673 RepID=A0A7E6E7L0_9CHIR|nr:gasdermin-D isoform X2 [Phyllostomus discolor]XP_035887378.1 gasdermin-D isoform X2 [Phyllostomus discolor]